MAARCTPLLSALSLVSLGKCGGMVVMDAGETKPWETPLIVADVAAWRSWLDAHEDEPDGAWLVLAKKGRPAPTTLTYDEALLEALCSGWIDGQVRGRDADTHLQRFTPRRSRSPWSERNTQLVQQLSDQGRMRPRGQAEIDRAKADGRWDRAYAGSATAEVPEDLTSALAAAGASDAFAALSRGERFTILYGLMTAATPATRANRLARAVEKLGAQSP